jgi:hypothetical protein
MRKSGPSRFISRDTSALGDRFECFGGDRHRGASGNVIDEEWQVRALGEIGEEGDKTALRRPHVIRSDRHKRIAACFLGAPKQHHGFGMGFCRDAGGHRLAAGGGLHRYLD